MNKTVCVIRKRRRLYVYLFDVISNVYVTRNFGRPVYLRVRTASTQMNRNRYPQTGEKRNNVHLELLFEHVLRHIFTLNFMTCVQTYTLFYFYALPGRNGFCSQPKRNALKLTAKCFPCVAFGRLSFKWYRLRNADIGLFCWTYDMTRVDVYYHIGANRKTYVS